MINPEELTAQLENIGKTTFTPDLLLDLQKAGNELKVLNTEMVGRINGTELNNGLKALSSVLSDFPKEAEAALSTALPAATTAVANLQTKIPGIQKALTDVSQGLPDLAAKLAPELESTANAALNAISGSTVKTNFNNIALTLPTPAAVAETVNAMSTAVQKVIPGIEAVTSLDIKATLTAQLDGIEGDLGSIAKMLGDIGGVANTLSGALEKFDLPDLSLPDIGNILGDKLTGAVADITVSLNANVSGLISSITGSPLLDVLHKANGTLNIVGGTLGISANIPNINGILGNVVNELTNGTITSALKILQDIPNLGIDIGADLNGFELKLQSLQNQFGSASAMLLTGRTSTGIQQLVTSLARTQTTVNSAEEIHTEITSAEKQPKAMEVSWTKTYKNEVVNTDNIRPKDHYHYIIQPNGITQRGKQVGDDRTIRVVLVGGYNVDRGEEGELTGASVTNTQKLALKLLMGQAVRATPGMRVYGKGELTDLPGGRGGGTDEPGVDISAMRQSIDGGGSAPISTPALPYKGGLPVSPRVVYVGGTVGFQKSNKWRNDLIQPRLMSIIDRAAAEADVYLTITSGGQMSKALWRNQPGAHQIGKKYYINWNGKTGDKVRIGSIRHDNGNAVDFMVYNNPDRRSGLIFPSVGGPKLKSNVNPPQKILTLLRAAKALGATCCGVGPGYMEGVIHLDITNEPATTWGRGEISATAPYWLKQIF
jgi:hypothetical protein